MKDYDFQYHEMNQAGADHADLKRAQEKLRNSKIFTGCQ